MMVYLKNEIFIFNILFDKGSSIVIGGIAHDD